MSTLLDDTQIDVLPAVREAIAGDHRLFIDGEFVAAADGDSFPVFDPSTGGLLAEVSEAGADDVDRAVRAASAALPAWSQTVPAERRDLLNRLANLLEEHAEEFAQIDSLNVGKPLAYAVAGDLPLAIDAFRYAAGWPGKIEGSTLTPNLPGLLVRTRPTPVGVVAAIIPWNYPTASAAWKLAPALAAGCTVVLKPAEQTPITALRLAALVAEAGFPRGVVNVVPGIGETAGAALVAHPGVDKVTFTGSTAVGKEISRQAADTLKAVSLELGGKSPNIVFADSDIPKAAAAAASAVFFNSGQSCSAGSRLMIERAVYDEVVELVKEEAAKLVVGPGLDPATTMGPLVSKEQQDRVARYLEIANEEGTAIQGGDLGSARDGYYIDPAVFVDVADDARIAQEEIFGPVVVAQPFDNLDDLARRANGTEFGLSAGVWTDDIRKANRVAEFIDTGTVWINTYNMFDATTPWGGVKMSGHGRDNGREGIENYFTTKVIWTSLD